MRLYRTTGNPDDAYHGSGFVVLAPDAQAARQAIIDHYKTGWREYWWIFPEDHQDDIDQLVARIQVEEHPITVPGIVAQWSNDC